MQRTSEWYGKDSGRFRQHSCDPGQLIQGISTKDGRLMTYAFASNVVSFYNQMQGYRKHSTNDVQDPYSYALPIDQGIYNFPPLMIISAYNIHHIRIFSGTDYPVPGSTSSFQRYFPFVTRLDVKGANYYLVTQPKTPNQSILMN